MSQAGRVSDYQILVGHLWQCRDCRETFLLDPQSVLVGLKLTEEQTTVILEMARTPFALPENLHSGSGLVESDFQTAVTHPRARLRHLGVRRANSLG